jgi:glutathione synthase
MAISIPPISQEQFEGLVSQISDYQLTHGSLLKTPGLQARLDSAVPFAYPIGVSAFPSPFPRRLFHHALSIQHLFNELYAKISEDDTWLGHVLAGLRENDDFTQKLWNIWEQVKIEGEASQLRCGIWRSDYILEKPPPSPSDEENSALARLLKSELRQVEFNTYSCAGGCHADIVAGMHRHLASKGAHMSSDITLERLPYNNTTSSIIRALQAAHNMYGRLENRAAILMTVQPLDVNIADERPLEYGLLALDPPIPSYRVEFGKEVIERCRLGPERKLLFQLPFANEPVEISVIYHRAGYDALEYDADGIEARLLLERSRAVKCPSILSHLSGFKKVQQELSRPGVLERFVRCGGALDALRDTFGRFYPMDDSEAGMIGRKVCPRSHN